MAINQRLLTTALAAALAGGALSFTAPVASAAAVKLDITESWSGTLPQRVEPGQTVTLLTSFGQNTYNQPVRISGLSFDLWDGTAVLDRDVQVQFMNPVTRAWVTVASNDGQSWTYEFDTFLTEEPGRSYSSGIRFTIDAKAPAGTWTAEYPTVWGVTTQATMPYGSITFPNAPTRNFAFKSAANSVPAEATHSTAPSSVTPTHAVAKAPSPSPSPRAVAKSTPSAAQTTAPAAALAPSSAEPSASTTPVNAAIDANAKPLSSGTPLLAAGAAATVVVLLLALALWRRLRRHGV